jgi:hypothetical protein
MRSCADAGPRVPPAATSAAQGRQVGGIAIGLAAVLSALMLFGCAARTPLRGDIEARSDHVLVGAVLIQLPPPRGMSRLDELKRPEAHLIGQAIIASAPASVRVLRVYVNPEQFQLDKFSLTAIVNVERDLEYVDVSLDAFQARKADLRAVVTSQGRAKAIRAGCAYAIRRDCALDPSDRCASAAGGRADRGCDQPPPCQVEGARSVHDHRSRERGGGRSAAATSCRLGAVHPGSEHHRVRAGAAARRAAHWRLGLPDLS